jgi:putative transposase
VLTIKDQQYYLWRVVDADGQVIDILIQLHRDKPAAKKFFRKLLKSTVFAPRVIVTNKLSGYETVKKELTRGVEHGQTAPRFEQSSGEFAQADPSERKAHGALQVSWTGSSFLSAFESIRGYFHPHQHRQSVTRYRETMRQRLRDWQRFMGLSAIA